MNEADAIFSKLRELRPAFQSMRLKRVRVFGSAARRDMNIDSDIDLLIEFESQPDMLELGEIYTRFEEELGRRVDLVQPHLLMPELRDKILAEARDV